CARSEGLWYPYYFDYW
nr:immunoglobulin heavy chain junction region [Mus musculus]